MTTRIFPLIVCLTPYPPGPCRLIVPPSHLISDYRSFDVFVPYCLEGMTHLPEGRPGPRRLDEEGHRVDRPRRPFSQAVERAPDPFRVALRLGRLEPGQLRRRGGIVDVERRDPSLGAGDECVGADNEAITGFDRALIAVGAVGNL